MLLETSRWLSIFRRSHPHRTTNPRVVTVNKLEPPSWIAKIAKIECCNRIIALIKISIVCSLTLCYIVGSDFNAVWDPAVDRSGLKSGGGLMSEESVGMVVQSE